MEPRYLCSVDGKKCGPYSFEELQGRVQSGQLLPTHSVWSERAGEWMTIAQLLQSHRPEPQTSAPPEVAQPPMVQPPPEAQFPAAVSSGGAQQPCVLDGMSEKHLGKFLAMMPPGGQPVVASKVIRDSSFIIIMIPLWFNIYWTYLIITDRCLAVGSRTLWMGCKEVDYIDFEAIEAITFVEEVKLLGNVYSVVVDVYGTEPVVISPILKGAYQFLVGNIPRLREVHPNVNATTVE
jgi:hypothetical protein